MDQVALHTTTSGAEAEIERALFELIQAYAGEPTPLVIWLADRIASHEIVTRLPLVPRPTFADSCRAITAGLGDDR